MILIFNKKLSLNVEMILKEFSGLIISAMAVYIESVAPV